MTQAKPDLTVVEALRLALERHNTSVELRVGDVSIFGAAIPIAIRQAEAEAKLIETKAALRWFIENMPWHSILHIGTGSFCSELIKKPDCPSIIKEMLEERK